MHASRVSGGVRRSFMRPQDAAGGVLVVALAGAAGAALARHWQVALLLLLVAAASVPMARWLSKRFPSPFRARFRFVLLHSNRDVRRLCEAVDVHPGARVLEIGPGNGQHAVAVAEKLGPTGRMDVLDVQPGMLDAVERGARRHGLTNVRRLVGDACAPLPYEDDTFDAAYLNSVLGELPRPDVTLGELQRVLRPRGLLVVGEIPLGDPDAVSLRTLRRQAEAAGFVFERRVGSPFSYIARFRAR